MACQVVLAESHGPLRPDRLDAGSLGAALFLVARRAVGMLY